MPSQETIQYTTAAALLTRMSEKDLRELTTEHEDLAALTSDSVRNAVDIVDGALTSGTPVEEKIAGIIRRAITQAEGRVSSRIGVVYELPATAPDGTVPGEIEDAVLTIAEFRLHSRRPSHRGISQAFVARYEEVDRWLKDVSQGKATIARLSADTQTETRRTSSKSGTARTSDRRFSHWS